MSDTSEMSTSGDEDVVSLDEHQMLRLRMMRHLADEGGREQQRVDAMARFAAAIVLTGHEHAPIAERPVLQLLAEADIRESGRVAHSSNAVFFLEIDGVDPHDQAQPLRAIYKPMRGERPLWDFPDGTLHLREAAAYVVDAALGFGLVPPTTLRDGPHGPGSIQLFVDVIGRELEESEEQALTPALTALAALDVLLNNADRKSGHLLVTKQGVRAIDNALSFLPYPRQRTVLIELGGAAVPPAPARAIAALAGDAIRRDALLGHLRLLLAEEEVLAFAARLDHMAEDPRYPALDPWDGRPFEMW